MYETEIHQRHEKDSSIPDEILSEFAKVKGSIAYRSVIPWGEHCTECAYPHCFTTCRLYSPREDRMCRLFSDGMVIIDAPQSVNGYITRIRFKQWGKLWSIAHYHLFSPVISTIIEKTHLCIGYCIRNFPVPLRVKNFLRSTYLWVKSRFIRLSYNQKADPDCFLVECFNPNHFNISLLFSIRPDRNREFEPFLKRLECKPCTFTRHEIPFSEILEKIGTEKTFKLEILPTDISEENSELTLYFGCLDFIRKTRPVSGSEKICKCVVWDLDNTIWNGTLVENGLKRLSLKDGVYELLSELDRRGILLSIASKNNQQDAVAALQKFGIEKYFLYPQISWEPKSESIRGIASKLNIGIDKIVFIDDQPFERAEVKSVLPMVTIEDAADYKMILQRPYCQVPVSEESSQRRIQYQQQQIRESARISSKNNYIDFLRSCRIQLTISKLSEDNMQRVYELAQRTNQLNFTGNRYELSELQRFIGDRNYDTFVIACEDIFGSYGIIGFSIVDKIELCIIDLMFSCRVQGKQVEHAFLTYLLQLYLNKEKRPSLSAGFRKTERNAAACKVFEDIGFRVLSVKDNLTWVIFSGDQPLIDAGLISVVSDV